MQAQHPISSFKLEVCVDSVASALAAQTGGADRIELCASLLEGGLTPSAGMIETLRKQLNIEIMVMIRPRGGDFLYSEAEYEVMQRDIVTAKQLVADGVVFGLLTADGEIDAVRTGALVTLARPLRVTFHRAFDMVADPSGALETLIQLGVDRVLTSGLSPAALQGAQTIAALHKQAAGRIVIMPGGGISESNIAQIAHLTGTRELHMSGRVPQESQMRFRNERINVGSEGTPEFTTQVTSAERIRASREALQNIANPS